MEFDFNIIQSLEIPNIDTILLIIKDFFIDSYNYIYPFFIKYMITINEYKLISAIVILILFHILYFLYLEMSKKNFNFFIYFILFLIMPISVIILSIINIDIFIKRFVIYKMFQLDYPYIPFEIKNRLDAIDREIELRREYNERFSK